LDVISLHNTDNVGALCRALRQLMT